MKIKSFLIIFSVFLFGLFCGGLSCFFIFSEKVPVLLKKEAAFYSIAEGCTTRAQSLQILHDFDGRPVQVNLDDKISKKCGAQYSKYYFQGNPSLLAGRFEDNFEIFFDSNDRVCHKDRIGL